MTSAIAGFPHQVPSARRFLGRLVDDLAFRRSSIILLPSVVRVADIWSMLESMLWDRDIHVESVTLPESLASTTPAAALGAALGVRWPADDAPRTTSNLLSAGGLPDVVALNGLESMSETDRDTLLAWLVQWAKGCRTLADRGDAPPALLLVVPALAVLPRLLETETHLAVHWWWGLPSALECRMLVRLANREDVDLRATWREHVLPSLAGSDALLLGHLWESACEEHEQLVGSLLSFAAMMGWTSDWLRANGIESVTSGLAHERGSEAGLPPMSCRMLWACGAVGWTREHGVEVHSAALALLGRDEDIAHRVWRGQAELVLPLLDVVRLSLCKYMVDVYGPNWPLRWYSPRNPVEEVEVRENPLACSWGHMEWLFRSCSALSREQRWLTLATIARRTRNNLAHYRPLAFADFSQLWYEIRRAQIDRL